MIDISHELRRRQEAGLYRRRRTVVGAQRPHLRVDGRDLLSFCSNDYLGLAADPRLSEALQTGAAQYGVGSGASHLITGHHEAHEQLEVALARFVQRDRALLFSTGYMANLGTIAALSGRGNQVLADRLNHASLIDGIQLGAGKLRRYPHNDPTGLSRLLARGDTSLIISDGLFSMDGDLADVPALAQVAQTTGARLMIDDAHGIGVLGAQGRGILEHQGLLGPEGQRTVPILVGTLGKALGTFGAFVAGSADLIDFLIQGARSYIYTTALPPALASATLAALTIVQQEPERRDHLQRLIQRFRAGANNLELPLMDSPTPIQPLIAGDVETALTWSQHLEAQGILVTPIRPPTVPTGAARLRITLSAAHEPSDIDRLLDALARLPQPTHPGDGVS